MRRPVAAVAVAVMILTAVTAGGLLIAACGGSSDSTSTAQTANAGGPGGQQPPDMSSIFASALDPLVSDGTITSDQESAVIDALSSAGPGGAQGQGQPGAGATPPSGQAPSDGATPPGGGQQGSMPDPSQMFTSALADLVSDGTITSSQQTAISDALSSAMQQAGPGQQQSSTSSTQG